ncbi:MAG: hypothetical protein MUC88_10205 [Planctomycetes bacterium]|jgi:hypothetical protein|nr:hypothetical protein [Planctomycetota bacterium]
MTRKRSVLMALLRREGRLRGGQLAPPFGASAAAVFPPRRRVAGRLQADRTLHGELKVVAE